MKRISYMFRGLRVKPRPTTTLAAVVDSPGEGCLNETITTTAAVVESPDDGCLNETITTTNVRTQDVDDSLETLPAEVRRHLLFQLDLYCLKALVHASPTFHQQYLLDRRHILRAALEVTLGSVSLDAHTVLKAKTQSVSTPQFLTGLLETWRGQLPHKQSYRLTGVITDDETTAMASFYFRAALPIATRFIEGIRKELESQLEAGQASAEPEPHPGPTNIEWQRCLRATYRFELLCCFTYPFGRESNPNRVAGNATCLFYEPEPWEGEELFCFYQFAQTVYQTVFDDIKDEVHPGNPRFDDQDRPPTPIGAFELHNTCKPVN